jgi:hypothetical protein
LEYHFPNGNASSAILTFESTPSIELRASGEKTNPFEPSKNEEEAGTRKVKSKGRATRPKYLVWMRPSNETEIRRR